MGSRKQTRMEIRRMRWHAPKEVPNLSSHLRKALRWTSLTNVQTISTFPSVWPVEVRPESSQSSTYVSPRLNHVSYSEVCVLLMAVPPKAVFVHKCVSNTFFPSQKQILRRMRRSFQSATGKSRIAINTHKNKHPLRINTESYGCKTPWVDSDDSDTTAPSDRKL